MEAATRTGLRVRAGKTADRDAIYALRHAVYAAELGQHEPNAQGRLTDRLDDFNEYLMAEREGRLVGFVSLTPPGSPSYSVEKYVPRERLPVPVDGGLWEVRLLTVAREHRRGPAAVLLMREALRLVRERGGERILIMGRRELVPFYAKFGLRALGVEFRSGRVEYALMTASVAELDRHNRPRAGVDSWLNIRAGASGGACPHGGEFFSAVGTGFDDLSRRRAIINADVLDAWFAPAPGAVAALTAHLEWSLSTSPPTHAEGLVAALVAARGVPASSLVLGAGSSALIFLAFARWLTPASRALILDPMYGEYAHVLERVIGCGVERLALDERNGFALDPELLAERVSGGRYDLVAIVNPNNPTGAHVPRAELERALRDVHPRTLVWIDEAYAQYAGVDESVEHMAASSRGVVVCKSMSKAYALSGARAAYLCGPAGIAADLRARTPPWAVSLPAQIAAVHALADPGYYAQRYAQTHELRANLAGALRALAPWRVIEGVINSVLCLLPPGMPRAARIVRACRARGVYIRDCSSLSPRLEGRAVRVAVRDPEANARVVAALAEAVK